MSAWQSIPSASGLKPGEMTHEMIGDTDVLVLNVDGRLRAFVNRCGHQNAPLDAGTFKGGVVKCALHNAVFDAMTGEVRGPPVLAMPGVDFSKLPKEYLDAMGRMVAVMQRIPCSPLVPLPIESSNGTVRVWA